MKRSTVILSILLMSFLSYTYGIITVQYKIFPFEIIRSTKNLLLGSTETRSPKYLHKKSFFEIFGQDDYDIVFIGDSITEGAQWEDIFPKYKIANRGIGGDTANGILGRIDSIKSTKARKAFIMVGINDFSKGTSVENVFNDYSSIIKELQEDGFKVYVQSTILGGSKVSRRVNSSINALNEKLANLVKNDSSLTYINLNTSLSKSGLLRKSFSHDDVHLNGNGYKAWQSQIAEYVKSE